MDYFNTAQKLPTVINNDFATYFMHLRMEYLMSEEWRKVEANFKRELSIHIIPNDLDRLISYLREQKEACLQNFRSKGLVASLWEKCYDCQSGRFDEEDFIKKLYYISDFKIDPRDLLDFFGYYCLNTMIETVVQGALKRKHIQTMTGHFNVFINNGEVSFGDTTFDEGHDDYDDEEEEEEEEEDIVKNLIFKTKIFDSNARLVALRGLVANAINMSEYNKLYGERNPYTIDPEAQNEWYYIMRALEEAEIVCSMTVPKFIDQMIAWFPFLFSFHTAHELDMFKRNLGKSISHEKGLWKYGRAKEVTRLKDMWARCQQLGIDTAKVDRMHNAVYIGLLLKLLKLRQDIEKQNAKR